MANEEEGRQTAIPDTNAPVTVKYYNHKSITTNDHRLQVGEGMQVINSSLAVTSKGVYGRMGNVITLRRDHDSAA